MELQRALPTVAITLAGLLAGCSGAQAVALAQLASQQETYAGQRIETSGEVREFSDRGVTYYVLEDADANRVQLRPAARVAPYVGRQMTVTGRFDVLPDVGRVLAIESVHG